MVYSHYSEYMARAMSAHRPGPDPGEAEFLDTYLKGCEQPFLELACGYGRLLLHIMARGYEIVGTDASPEMLRQCEQLAQSRGLKPTLHRQFMQRLSLQQTFGLIFIDDCTFALVVEDPDVTDLFRRVWDHLKPGGTFLFDFFAADPQKPPASGQTSNGWVKAPDGAIYVSKKISSYDPATRITSRLQIHDCYVDGKLVGSQAYEDPNRDHDPLVVEKLLSAQGFAEIRFGGYHTEDPPSADCRMLSVRCRRPR